MLSVSITILTVLLVVVSLLMILLVLMQRPKQEGLGAAFGGGMMNDIAGAHTTDILQKSTVWLSVMFFSISIVLGILYTREISAKNNIKVLEGVEQPLLPETPPPFVSEFPPPTPADTPPPTPAGETAGETPPAPAPAAEEGEGDNTPKPADGETAPPAEAPAPVPEAEKGKPDDGPSESSESNPEESGEAKKPAESGTTPQ